MPREPVPLPPLNPLLTGERNQRWWVVQDAPPQLLVSGQARVSFCLPGSRPLYIQPPLGIFPFLRGSECSEGGISHRFENTPHPFTPSPLPSPSGRGKRGRGVGERGHFRHIHGFRVPASLRA